MTVKVGVVVVLSFISCIKGSPAKVCPNKTNCLPATDCKIKFDDYVIYPCNNGKKVCCPVLDNRKLSNKIENEFDFVTIATFGDEWRNQNFNQNEGFTLTDEKRRTGFEENGEFSRNSTLTASISSRPVSNFYPNGFKESTSNPIADENVRLNIPDYKTDFDNRGAGGDKKVGVKEIGYSVVRRQFPFKENCGLTFADNKVTGGKVAEIGQFPWMALLAFKQSAQPNPQFLCGGSLITSKHVLTAAHCIVENKPLELVFVRLGEYNLTSSRDCVNVGNDRVICADQHLDVPVDQVTVHPEYNRRTLKNDIAIIRFRFEVRESDYVRTICLPFNKIWSYSELTDQNFTVSGWGKTQSGNLFGSDVLQYAKVTTWDRYRCNSSIPTQVKPLSDTQLCANGHNTEDACKGDSGGPLINITLDKNLEVRHIQFGIVSFGTATCGDKNLPTIYTRVDTYLKWIVDIVT